MFLYNQYNDLLKITHLNKLQKQLIVLTLFLYVGVQMWVIY